MWQHDDTCRHQNKSVVFFRDSKSATPILSLCARRLGTRRTPLPLGLPRGSTRPLGGRPPPRRARARRGPIRRRVRQATDIVGAADKRSVDPHHRERPCARSVQHADVRVPASPQLVDGHRTIRTLPHERIKHHDEAFFGGGRSLASCATGHVSGVRARDRKRGKGVGCVPSLAWSGRDVKRGVSSLLEAIFFSNGCLTGVCSAAT